MKNTIEIKAVANQSKRTFIITKVVNGEKSKYRTISFSKDEFEEMEYNTQSDWVDFLRNSQDYSIVK